MVSTRGDEKGASSPANLVEDLIKIFDGLRVVDGVSFPMSKGEVFGFLGPDGASKTTSTSLLCTLIHPSSGKA